MRFGVVIFPGSNCEQDVIRATHFLGFESEYIWHGDTDLSGFDAIVLPGGFSYGDYIRTGAVARFSPVMAEVVRFAEKGGPVLGICNGFQILAEAHLLPGALLRNRGLKFICKNVNLRVDWHTGLLGPRFFGGRCVGVDRLSRRLGRRGGLAGLTGWLLVLLIPGIGGTAS